MQQGRGYRRIDTAGKTQQYLLATNLLADLANSVVHNAGRGPQCLAVADILHEVLEDTLPLQGMGDLGMELDAIEATTGILHGGDWRALGGCQQLEALRQCNHLVTMAHPDIKQGFPLSRQVILDIP